MELATITIHLSTLQAKIVLTLMMITMKRAIFVGGSLKKHPPEITPHKTEVREGKRSSLT